MKAKRTKLLLLSLLIVSSFSASIYGDDYRNVDCSEPKGNYAFSYCIRSNYEKADEELNSVYKKLKQKLTYEEKKLLLNAQRAWIQFRDNDCEL